MFGRGRFQNGILIQPKEPFDPSDEAKLEDYRNKIWCVCVIASHTSNLRLTRPWT